MKKSTIYFLILLTVTFSLILNVFFGRFLSAKFSTLPIIKKFKIFDPQAPIVIYQREEVRVSDTGDVLNALELVRPKLSSVVTISSKEVVVLAGAINMTSDGMFVTTKNILSGLKPEQLFIKTENGKIGKVVKVSVDPVTNLAILTTDLQDIPVTSFGDSAAMKSGQKIIFVGVTLFDHDASFNNTFVTKTQSNSALLSSEAGVPKESFSVQPVLGVVTGASAVNIAGEVVGMWDGATVISSEVLQKLIGNFLATNKSISRPSFGFNYKLISNIEASIMKISVGARVLSVSPNSVSQKAGLAEQDIITSVQGQVINEKNTLEKILQSFMAGDTVKFQIMRGMNTQTLSVIVGEAK